jgi:ABC-2 type transport system permease protein
MSLLQAELRRLPKRRITRWMLLLVLVLMPTVAVLVGLNHQRPGPAAVAEAEQQAAEEFRSQQVWMEEDIDNCERMQEAGTAEEYGYPEDCQEIRSWYPAQEEMVEWYMPPAFDFRDGFPDMALVLTGLLAMFGFIVGASYVGAEWRTGGMMNLLLWRPRRLVVLGTKLGAMLAGLTALTVVLGAAWTGMFWMVATLRGITDTMTPGAWQSFGLTGLRALVLVLAAGAIGFALASFGRHTAMAMGVAIGAFVIGVAGVGIIAGGMLQLPMVERYLWSTYIYAWMERSVVLTDWNAQCEPGTGINTDCVLPTFEVTWQMSGFGIATVLAVVLVASMWQMRQRDVT